MMTRPYAAAALAVAALALTACSADSKEPATSPDALITKPILEAGQANPMIAQGVVIANGAALYKTSGIGPVAANKAAREGSPESFVDTAQFAGGVLPPGVSLTEAQGMAVLSKIKENLEAQGLALDNVTTMRVFLDNAPGTDRADYAGWNRAYRQFFANTNLGTGDTELVPLGTAAPAAPAVRNAARPTRFALEVASLPVLGWLVEVEVDAVYPARNATS